MTLDAGILHGKEHRGPYRKSGIFDRTCRPGGSCPYCRGNRAHKNDLKILSANEAINEFLGTIEKRLWEKWEKDIIDDQTLPNTTSN